MLVPYGAQWFLVTYWICATILPFMVRACGLRGKAEPKPFAEWLGERLFDFMGRMTLAAILWWGGFWS